MFASEIQILVLPSGYFK